MGICDSSKSASGSSVGCLVSVTTTTATAAACLLTLARHIVLTVHSWNVFLVLSLSPNLSRMPWKFLKNNLR
jgi:Asp/Glu/hydantoin racemase